MFIHGHRRDSTTRQTATDARRSVRDAQTKVEGLEYEVERLLMITEALWTLVKDQHGYTDDTLMAKIEEIDLSDGRLDGRVNKREVQRCGQCNRSLHRRRLYCIYCGTPYRRAPFAR